MRIVRRFPLGVQLTLPKDYRRSEAFARVLTLAKERGLTELELNIVDPETVNPGELRDYLGDFGLSVTRLASGAYAKVHGLSLSSTNEEVRRNSVSKCAGLIRYAESFPAELIIGLLKGAPETDSTAARERFITSLSELARDCAPSPVFVLLEATNRYESAVANTVEEASALCSRSAGLAMGILPDTFHMNIEEADTGAALTSFRSFYHSLHISDNNRLLPGFGQLDFGRVFKLLTAIGYTGSLVLEGNTRGSLTGDLDRSISYVDHLLDSFG